MNTNRRTDFKLFATQRHGPDDGCGAFTLTDLLVVLFILGILALLLRPALAGSQQEAKSFQCLGNMRQMTQAWILYAQDNHDILADNHDNQNYPTPPWRGTPCWCEGELDWTVQNTDNTNTLGLIGAGASLLGPYVANDVQLFRCPADVYLSPPQRAAGWPYRCRSIAMNGLVGPGGRWLVGWPSGLTNPVTKMSGFTILGPAMSFVFLDVNPDSINNAQFYVDPAETNGVDAGGGQFTQLPGANHNNGASISFADGHAEIHKWLDSRTIHVVEYVSYHNEAIIGTPDVDLAWLAQRTPYQQSAW